MYATLAEWQSVVNAELERLLPREIKETYLVDFFGQANYNYDAVALQRALSTPIWTLLDRGGKRWRPAVFLLLIEAFGEDPYDYLPYACIPEILHTGTLIVDDVEDEAAMRRGGPALHHEYGTDMALNAGNAMYFLPLKIISQNPGNLDCEERLTAYDMLMHELNRTHLGQGMDIYWHNEKAVRVDEDQYFEMCACKTGCLARIAAQLAAIVTNQDERITYHTAKYAELMSIAFQISDDILDIENTLNDDDAFGKAFGNDIIEGKKTLMVIHAVNRGMPERAARLEDILWSSDNTREEIFEAIHILQDADSIEYAREQARELAINARKHLEILELDSDPAAHLREFTRFVVERDT